MRGHIVLAPGYFNHSIFHEKQYNAEERKGGLDILHLKKIEQSDAVFVIDVFDYIGKSTFGEVRHAEAKGKRVFYWSRGDLFHPDLRDGLRLKIIPEKKK